MTLHEDNYDENDWEMRLQTHGSIFRRSLAAFNRRDVRSEHAGEDATYPAP